MTKHINCAGTRKRKSKQVRGKTTLKYGGGRRIEWAKRNLVPKRVAKRLGWRKSSPSAQEEQSQTLPERYSNREPSPIPTDDSEEERAELARKRRAAPQPTTIPATAAKTGTNYEDEINPYAEIENIGAAGAAHNTPPNTKDNDLKMVPIDWKNRQHISPKALNPNALYITAANIRKMKTNQNQTREVLTKFKFPSAPKMPPTPPPKLSKNQLSSSEHIYDVLPPKMPETLERLPRRNSLKKTKPPVIQNWETAMAAAQKPLSPKTRKSPPKTQTGKVQSIVANWGKK